MPSFDSPARWQRYEPCLGNNLELPQEERFFLRVRAGITKTQYDAYRQRLTDAATQPVTRASLERLYADLVEMGTVPLSIDGKPIATIGEYYEVISTQRGADLHWELQGAVEMFNAVAGAVELFFGRLSGGDFITRHAPAMADARSGSATRQ